MSNTDFFDDDLIKKREPEKRAGIGRADDYERMTAEDPVAKRSSLEPSASRMAKHRDEVEDKVAKTTEELERLRQRQDALEKERRDLQELRARQDEFETSRRNIIDSLGQTILTLEKDQIRAEQAADLIGSIRQRFKTMLGELEELDAESWEEPKIRDELGKGIAIIEDARMEFNKSMAKVDAVRDFGCGDGEEPSTRYDTVSGRSKEPRRGFASWLGVGFAVSLPMIVTVILVAAALYVLLTRGPF